MSNTNVIIPQRANDKASLALSSFIHALFELETYAVARLVTKEAKPPMIVLLAPSIEPDYECLIELQLPFAEDVRSYRFPPLDKVVTVSGKIVTEHRNLPNDDLKDAMSQYVDSMELDLKDDDGCVHPLKHSKSSKLTKGINTETLSPDSLSKSLSLHYCIESTPQCDTAPFIPTIPSWSPQSD